MKRFPRFVEPNLGLKGSGQNQHVLLGGEVQGLSRDLHGLGKTSRFGVSGGQRVEGADVSMAGKLAGPLG